MHIIHQNFLPNSHNCRSQKTGDVVSTDKKGMQLHLWKGFYSFIKTVGSNDCESCPRLFICNFFKAGCKLVSFSRMAYPPVLVMSILVEPHFWGLLGLEPQSVRVEPHFSKFSLKCSGGLKGGAYWATARDGFKERGALGHLSFEGSKHMWPIWPFVWKAW